MCPEKELGKGLEHKLDEEQLRQLGVFQPGKKEAQGIPHCLLQLLSKEVEVRWGVGLSYQQVIGREEVASSCTRGD